MIAKDRDLQPAGDSAGSPVEAAGAVPPGLPPDAACSGRTLATGELLQLLAVPLEDEPDPQGAAIAGQSGRIAEGIGGWVAAGVSPPARVVFIPLYGCQVSWTAGRAAVVGPPKHLGQLESAVLEFAAVEAEVRDAERRATALLDTVERDVAESLEIEPHSPERRAELAARHREAVAVGRQLALLAPAVHAPPLHPPTLASQLGERLRERTRLIERHEFATQRAELAERVAEACGQRALETGIARRQLGLEWAIVILLVVQTVLLLVELLAQRAAS